MQQRGFTERYIGVIKDFALTTSFAKQTFWDVRNLGVSSITRYVIEAQIATVFK